MAEVKVVKVNIQKMNCQIIPKILYGIDNKGHVFIFYKMKDLKISKSDPDHCYVNESFVIMYQSPLLHQNEIMNRKQQILDWLNKKYQISEVRSFKGKNHFFIKKRVFKTFDKAVRFYSNMITAMASDFGENIDPLVFQYLQQGKSLKDITAPLNYVRPSNK